MAPTEGRVAKPERRWDCMPPQYPLSDDIYHTSFASVLRTWLLSTRQNF